VATKRTPLKRPTRRPRITPEAVALFARVEQLAETHDACDDNGNCKANDPGGGERCAECAEYYVAILELHRLLAVMPWQPGPNEVDDPEPPDYIAGDALKVADWRRAWTLRRELEALAGAKAALHVGTISN
jgi:hypothetical protein